MKPFSIVEILATGFYAGKIKPAPGTWGTIVAIPIAVGLAWMTRFVPLAYLALSIASVFVASIIAELHERNSGAHDPGEIVVDEIVGYLIAAAWLPFTWQTFVAAFVAFRFFDILKPFPISYIDRKIEGGLGTVLDDVAAGIIANVILQIVYTQTAWLGVRFYVP